MYLSRNHPDTGDLKQLLQIPDITSGAAPSTARISTQLLAFIAPALGPLADDLYAAARSPDSTTLARAFVALYKIDKAVDELKKLFGALTDTYKSEVLPDAFELDQINSVPLQEGYRVTMSAKIRASIRRGQQPSACVWLRENHYGDLIKPAVNANSLSSLATTMLREELREMPDTIFNVAICPSVSVTGTGAKKSKARPDFSEAE